MKKYLTILIVVFALSISQAKASDGKLYTVTAYPPSGVRSWQHVVIVRTLGGGIIQFFYNNKEVDLVGMPIIVEEE